MVQDKELDTEVSVSEDDKPVTMKQLNAALTNYRRQIQKDFQGALGEQTASKPSRQRVEESDETLTLREEIRLLKEKDRQRDAELKQERMNKTVRDNLARVGVDPRYLDHAFKSVRDDVSWDTDGTLVMKDEFGVAVPLAEALSNWAAQESSAIFKAPKNVAGSGAQPANPTRPQVKPPANPNEPTTIKSAQDAKAILASALKNGANITR